MALHRSHSRVQLELSTVLIPRACGISPELPRSLRAEAQAIFWAVRKLRTVSLGCAPHPSQYLMRSASSVISAGKQYPYPSKLSTLNFTYVRGVSPAANTTLFNIPTTTPTNGLKFPFQVLSDGDFVLRAIQAGPTASNLSWEVFLRLRDSDGYPYSSDFVHADVLAGNSTGPATYPTGTSFQAAIGTGPSVPGILYPEIYIPNHQYIDYEILRTDASFVAQGAVSQDFPIAFMGAKVFAR